MSIISNTTVISNFAIIEQLALLQALYDRLYISTDVHAEIQAGLDEGYRFYAGLDDVIYPMSPSGWIRLTSVTGEQELRLLGQLPRRLHSGEASCLAIAKHRDWIVLTDDLAARKEAARLGVRVSGSVGCLVLAVEQEIWSLEQANHWLNVLRKHNYRSPVTDLTPLLT
jgi:predicted nucleic acid-binding protein